ncbi:MAG: glycosyltransferase family 2 protein [Elusimicrobia bacterium]|nr:glycosyltransferase family 2 protein [Elusimicrobiota bacterium]
MNEPAERADISVVIPCLNEAGTLAEVIREAEEGIASTGLRGEVVVADNGSADGSQKLAEASGARVVNVPIRGYGAALHFGILGARGRWVLFGDADLSYDFRLLPRFLAHIQETDPAKSMDLVLGSRLRGTIEPGAMPFLNRHLGTPVLNLAIRVFTGLSTSDCNSGMRLVRTEFYRQLPMRAPGMEWASELLIKTQILGGRYAEVPITLRPDKRGRPPHMRRWRDGWRHLKSIVLLNPDPLIVLPSLALLGLAFVQLWREQPVHVLLSTTLGGAGMALAMLVKLVLHVDGVRRSPLIGLLLRHAFAELMLGTGFIGTVWGVWQILWVSSFSVGSLLVLMTGTLLLLLSFAWGVLVTHCLHTLDSR